MELVYLWIEEYKNIENQGFNFSPKFDCKYDKETNELIIDENKDYVSIFPDNINITAIVGENGSGKSTLLKFVMDCFMMSYDNYSPNNFLLLYTYKDKLHLFHSGISINNEEILKESFSIETQNTFLLNKGDEQEGHDSIISLFINNEYANIEDRHSSQFFIENSKKSLSEVNKLLIENSFKLKDNIPNFQNIFIPKKIGIKLDKIDEFTSIISKDRDFYDDETWLKVTELSTQLKNSTFFQKINLIKEVFKIKRTLFRLIGEENSFVFNRRKDTRYFQFEYKDFAETVPELIKSNTSKNQEFILDIQHLNEETLTFIQNLPKEFVIELKDEERSFSNLSFGERQLLIQMHTILKYLLEECYYTYTFDHEGRETEYETKIEEITIFLDEFEIGLHPNWQKQFIQHINELFKFTEKKIHLFVTTHSPFLLSDMPKEQVVFLQKGEQKQPFKDNQTFGANIHTLLSDGFFMDNGLMGEFAKGKIEEIISFHKDIQKENINKEEKRNLYINDLKEKFWHIQSIIGDDYLKQVIKNHLIEIEKILLGKDEAKKEEIIRLKAQIDLLE